MRIFVAMFLTSLYLGSCSVTMAQGPLDDDGKLVQFERDIAPIFREFCLECHSERSPKGDFRIDDRDDVLNYLEPGDVEASSLFVDFLTADSEDLLMPPPSHEKPLSVAQLSLIRTWITEGAEWPESVGLMEASDSGEAAQQAVAELPSEKQGKPFLQRLWEFQGVFHPATIHFPIALFLVGAFFVVLGWRWPAFGTQVPLACLFIGAITSVVASMMGWAFAPQQGYARIFDASREIFWHRWSGIILSILSVGFALVALKTLRQPRPGLDKAWKAGLLVLAGIAGLVGHQGGELNYGKDFYPDAIQRFLGSRDQPAEAEGAAEVPASVENGG